MDAGIIIVRPQFAEWRHELPVAVHRHRQRSHYRLHLTGREGAVPQGAFPQELHDLPLLVQGIAQPDVPDPLHLHHLVAFANADVAEAHAGPLARHAPLFGVAAGEPHQHLIQEGGVVVPRQRPVEFHALDTGRRQPAGPGPVLHVMQRVVQIDDALI